MPIKLNIEDSNTTENLAYKETSSALERGKISKELDFFADDQSENFQNKLQSLDLNEEFTDFFMYEECKDAPERNNIKTHIDCSNIFIDNQNTNESLYDFLQNQQNEKEKQLPIDFFYDDDYSDYNNYNQISARYQRC